MATIYPSGIDNNVSIPQTIDLVTPVAAEVTNTLRDAIIAIEAELGIDPSREYGTVRARLDDIQSQLGCDGNISVSENGVIVVSEAVNLNFVGGVTVTDTGSGVARIEIIGSDGYAEQESFTPSASQTIFTLSTTPSDDTTVMMFINGIKYEHGVDYTVSGTTVTYLNAFVLGPTDTVEFWYLVEGGGGGGGGGGPGTITVQDEGLTVDLDTSIINFIGAGVTAASGGAGIVNVTIPGGGGSGEEIEVANDLTTVNATPVAIITETPTNGTVTNIVVKFAAYDSVAQEGGVFISQGAFITNGGATTQIGTTAITHIETDDATWTVDFATSGADIQVIVQGDAVNSTNWRAVAKMVQVV